MSEFIFFKKHRFLGQCKREHEVFKEGVLDKGQVLGLLSMLE